MNIFILDTTPYECAIQQCDKHCVKMVLESAQMLCTIQRFHGNTSSDLYKSCHLNHPCTVWARETTSNYEWLFQLFVEQCKEYTFRYGKVHSSERLLPLIEKPPNTISVGSFTQPALCMPDIYKPRKVIYDINDAVTAYRKFYIGEKSEFAKWGKTRQKPNWFV